MPQAYPFLAQAAAYISQGAAYLYNLYGSSFLFRTAVQVGFSVGTSALVASMNKPPKPGDRKESLRGEILPRPVNFGLTLAGSSVVYDDVASKTRWQVHVHNHGQVERLIERRFGGKPYLLDAAGQLLPFSRFQDSPYAEFRDGAEDQAASVLMMTPDLRKGPLAAPGWTADHRLRGLAYSVIRAPSVKPEKFSEIYPEGRPPVPSIIGEFGRPLDPRTGQRAYTPNGALIFAWFLTHPLGGRVPESRINWDALAEAANAADRLGYELAGSWNANEAPKVAQTNMLAALDAAMWTGPDGRIRLDLGEWRDPTVTLAHDHVLQVQSLSAGSAEGEALTEQVVKFPDRERDYSEVEEVAASIDGPVYEPRVSDLTYCPTKTQALRLGRRIFTRDTARWRADLSLNLAGLRLINQRFAVVHLPDFGLHHEAMELDSWGFDPATGQVSASLRSVAPEHFT
ncbi:MAG: hypothetical protein IPK75_12830 [Acidobacteria bacterium]|nr:hypothetical protein [Acidobacteriota bacterium]